ncbi:MAG: hypothetical protein ACOH1Y_11235 [Propionicimonas sp.]
MNGRNLARGSAVVVGVLALGSLTFWAGAHTAEVVADSSRATVATATSDVWTAKTETVGRTLRLSATLQASSRPGPLAQLAGVVTQVSVHRGDPVAAGEELIEISGQAVFAGVGTVPAYRALHVGDTGTDVTQVRAFLCAQGVLVECRSSVRFDAQAGKAVAAWHRRHGLKGSSLELGEIMWFPHLPLQVAVAAKTGVGSQVAATDRPLDVVSGTVSAQVKLSRDQAALVPPGSKVTLGTLSGVTGSPESVGDGTDAMRLPLLSGAGKRSLCAKASECLALLDGAVTRTLDASCEVIPHRSGIGVPAKALQTAADGATYVIADNGQHIVVTELQAAGGMVLVEGLPAGTGVRLSANE